MFILSESERAQLLAPTELADSALRESQIYFQKRAQWSQSPVTGPKGPGSQLARPLGKFEGYIGLAKDPTTRGTLYAYENGRLLLSGPMETIPYGCWIALEHDGLSVNDRWSNLAADNESREAIVSILDDDLILLYNSLFEEGTKHNIHLLHFVHHLKQQRKPWGYALSKVCFKRSGLSGMFGGDKSVSLGNLYAQSPSFPNSNIQSFGEMAAEGRFSKILPVIIKNLSLSRKERSLLEALTSSNHIF